MQPMKTQATAKNRTQAKEPSERAMGVLLVDDSPTVRAVLRRVLKGAPELRIVGEAEDGESAVDMAIDLQPEVILMDISMPGIDGFEATSRIMARAPTAIMVFSTEARVSGDRTIFEAVERGARSVLPKPESPDDWSRLAEELPAMVRDVALAFDGRRPNSEARPIKRRRLPSSDTLLSPSLFSPIRYLAIGASTGGPEALREFFGELGPDPPFSVLVVQHIAPEFEQGLVDWLRRDLHLNIALAVEGEIPERGEIRIAPQGSHLVLRQDGSLHLDRLEPPRRGHRPAVDDLMLSCAESVGLQAAGIVLSGMGRDGVVGLGALQKKGSLTLVQSRSTAVLDSMPCAALEAGAAKISLSPRALAKYVLEACGVKSDGGKS